MTKNTRFISKRGEKRDDESLQNTCKPERNQLTWQKRCRPKKTWLCHCHQLSRWVRRAYALFFSPEDNSKSFVHDFLQKIRPSAISNLRNCRQGHSTCNQHWLSLIQISPQQLDRKWELIIFGQLGINPLPVSQPKKCSQQRVYGDPTFNEKKKISISERD